ncbi:MULTISPECIES: efflux RND transporter permease subunit [Bacillus]|uniref:Multidrug transporter AcrB n=2 Tax=Bacillus TaxID=1386 RepID=A0A0M3R8Y6_9BACI|nr:MULTISPECIES: efflux RND transporter permease subunit [Bacillus]ALC80502.1 multidrug transporter AcrB [Bacillus gobiensis]MBP1083574.1 HAE1 family hydrophobic/amphiphilic exporter-1 [Bacillus capparidis]MED1094767.1 efflux RND transporter permease subunit [Bacillus capparidis]
MSWITKWSFKNKAAVWIMGIIILVMGIISYIRLPMEFFPSTDMPMVSVITTGQGMDANTMESEVTDPIEQALDSVKGKTNILSTSGDSFSNVQVHLEAKTDMKEAKAEVEDLLNALTLPQNVSKPTISQLNTSMIPVSYVSLSFEGSLTSENIKKSEEEIVPLFKDIEGVASVQTMGVAEDYVSVTLDETKMKESNVSVEQIMTLLQGQNLNASIGEKNIDGRSTNVKVVGQVNNIDELKNAEIVPSVPLKNIANVEIKKPEDSLTRINGEGGLILVVTKDSQSNAVTVSHKVNELSDKINEDNKGELQSNVILETADTVESSVHSMMNEVLLGALFATIVIMIFLRNLKSTFITIVSIPLSLGLTLFLLSVSGVTLNILTLGGVAVAVGRLVDDSIVVIENIFRKSQNEKFSVSMIIDATKEVGSAITASTLTTVAVFLPMGLVNGGLQDLLLPFALTITYSLLASLLVALTVVPLMSAGLLKNSKLKEHIPSKRFGSFLTWSLSHKLIVLGTAFVLFAGSIGAYMVLPKGSIAKTKNDYVVATLDYPNEVPIEDVKDGALTLEKHILEQEGVEHAYLQLGNSDDSASYGQISSPTQAQFMVTLKEGTDEEKFLQNITDEKDQYPEAQLSATGASMMGGGQTEITVDVLGDDPETLSEVALTIKDKIDGIEGIEKVTSNQEDQKTVYSFAVKPGATTTDQVVQQAGTLLNQTPIGTVEVNDQQADVKVEPLFDPKTEKDLADLPVATQTGMASISDIATLTKEEEPTNIYHKDNEQYVRVTANVDPKQVSDISAEISTAIFGNNTEEGIDLPDDTEVLVGGASADQSSDFSDMFITMLASIAIVFVIMVVTFKTIRTPIAILFSLPLAAIGAILALIITRIPVDVTSLLGALMLIGVVVTNAIVLLDRVKQNEESMSIRDSLVEAASVRMRPIIMTAVATICAMLPLLFKESESGNLVSGSLAVVVIGGLGVSTVLTLIVVPVIYELLYFKKSKRERKALEETKTRISI